MKRKYVFFISILLLGYNLKFLEIKADTFIKNNGESLVSTGTYINPNETISESMSKSESHHAYEIELKKPAKLTINFSSNFSSYFSLKDENGHPIISSLFSTNGNSQYLREGKYKVEVWNQIGSGGGEYELTTILEEFDFDEIEPNDTIENAQLIDKNSSINGALVYQDKSDWFKFTLTESSKIEMGFSSSTAFICSLRDENKEFISSCKSDNEYVEEGTYYILVENGGFNRTGTYTFDLNVSPINNQEIEPNNTPETAQLLNLNQSIKGLISYQDKTDMYKIDISEPGYLTGSIKVDNSHLSFQLLDSGLNSMANYYLSDTYKEIMFREYLDVGVFYIKISDNGCYDSTPTKCGVYDLQFNFLREDTNEIEPNNTLDTARELLIGEEIKASFSIRDRVDIYKINVNEVGRLDINFVKHESSDVTTPIKIKLIDKNGNIIENEIYTNQQFSSYVMPGTYYIELLDKDTMYHHKLYQFNTFFNSITVNNGANNDLVSAKRLKIGDQVNGLINFQDNSDYYTFTLTKDEIVNFNLKSDLTDLTFILQDEDENIIYANTASNQNETLSLKSGVYYIKILSFSERYQGLYQLKISNNHIKRVSYFKVENDKLYIDGYSYIKGINIPNQSDIIQKLKFVDANNGKQVKTYELPNYYSTAASKDPNHGAGIYNYDWAKFKGYLDVSDLPIGDYYLKIYTNAKGNKYDEVIDFHSSISDFSFQSNGKEYKFVREGSTLRLTVTRENPHVKRVSYFRAENEKLYIDGYSYIKGIHIQNQSDIIQKLKFVDSDSGKQVKTYELPNYYSTAASKDPNHGAGIYNYDWAKFKGYLDVSDLPTGAYYIKIYTNAKGNKYDEIIHFHSSIQDFSFKVNRKQFIFKREGVTLKLIVEPTEA